MNEPREDDLIRAEPPPHPERKQRLWRKLHQRLAPWSAPLSLLALVLSIVALVVAAVGGRGPRPTGDAESASVSPQGSRTGKAIEVPPVTPRSYVARPNPTGKLARFYVKTSFIDSAMKSAAKAWMMDTDRAVPKLKEDDILKNPGTYVGKGYRTYFKGKIIQIRESGSGEACSGWLLLGRCSRSTRWWGCVSWGDPIYVTYRGCASSPRKGKWVTVYGYVMGNYSYRSVAQHDKTVAWIHAKYMAW